MIVLVVGTKWADKRKLRWVCGQIGRIRCPQLDSHEAQHKVGNGYCQDNSHYPVNHLWRNFFDFLLYHRHGLNFNRNRTIMKESDLA